MQVSRKGALFADPSDQTAAPPAEKSAWVAWARPILPAQWPRNPPPADHRCKRPLIVNWVH